MKLEQSFDVAAPLQRVWEALIDVEQVAPCLPGAAVTGRNDDGSYNGTFKVKIGPTSAAYSGKLAMENVDEEAHTATMQAQGTDKRGQGGAKATILSKVSDAGNGSTHVEVVTDYHITGRLARFGRGGMIEEISNRLLSQFAQSLQSSLAGGEAVPGDTAGAAAAGPNGATATAAVEPPADAAADGETEAEPATAAPPPTETSAPAAAQPPTRPQTSAPAAAQPPAPPPTETSAPAAAQPPTPAPSQGAVQESEPLEGISFMASVLWSQAKKNPVPLAALVVGFLLALRLLRRRG